MKLSASHVTRPKPGEVVNGDAVVTRITSAHSLLAIVDALGHGAHAAEVAHKAVRYLESVALDLEVRALMTGLHAELRDTRGAAAMLCSIHGDRIAGCGVGNVELRIVGSTVPVVLSPGVLGGSVRQFRIFHGQLHPRSRLVLFSDGISARFSLETLRHVPAADACHQLLSQHGRAHDDATALVADFDG
jgi:negative regulator of sigma-B (phosphoserine phosphatase)